MVNYDKMDVFGKMNHPRRYKKDMSSDTGLKCLFCDEPVFVKEKEGHRFYTCGCGTLKV